MKKLSLTIAVAFLALATFAGVNAKAGKLRAAVVAVSGGHAVALSWTAPSDAVSGSTYNAYRLNAGCPASVPNPVKGAAGWSVVNASAIAATSFTDSSVGVGNWCYAVTQVQGGAESGPSNSAAAVLLPLPPAAVAVSSSQ